MPGAMIAEEEECPSPFHSTLFVILPAVVNGVAMEERRATSATLTNFIVLESDVDLRECEDAMFLSVALLCVSMRSRRLFMGG